MQTGFVSTSMSHVEEPGLVEDNEAGCPETVDGDYPDFGEAYGIYRS